MTAKRARRSSARESSGRVSEAADQGRREQLERILRSETFQQADRLKRFLTFIVEEALAGRHGDLKEYVIGVQVFRKDDTFDPRTDPIVRVQARRLRAKLMRYYRDEGRADPVTIDLPKGGYVPTFRVRETPVLVKRSVSAAFVSRNTVLVQTFADHGLGRELAAVCEGLRDELIHRLTNVQGIRVFASRGGGQREEVEAATRGVALIVGGVVRHHGGRVRINVHLIDGASGCYLWSEMVDTDVTEAFEAQERVALAVVQKLEPEVRAGRRVSGISEPSENLAAKNLYLQGRYHLSQRTDEGLLKAVEFFEAAVSEGAEYAPAHSGLADAYGLLAHYGVLPPADAWTKAASQATSAVSLDGLSPEAHTSLAHVKATQNWDWIDAERGYQQAIVLDPSYATAHHWYAISCLAPLGRLGEALEEIVIAQRLDPVSSIIARDVAVVHFLRRDLETALEQCDQTIELNPHFGPTYWTLGIIQEQLGDLDEAIAAFQRAIQLAPKAPRVHGGLGRAYALSGRKREAREVLKTLDRLAAERYVAPLDRAWIHFGLGDLDAGFELLERAFRDRTFELIFVRVDPRFDPMREDDRFKALTQQLGFD